MTKYTPTKKYRVRLTRLVEQECEIYVDVPVPHEPDDVLDSALEIAEEVAETIWTRDGTTAPHTYAVESVVPAESINRHKE